MKYLADFNADEQVRIITNNEIVVIREQASDVTATPSVDAEVVTVEDAVTEEPSDDNGEKVG